MNAPFEYIINSYKVPAEIHREVIVGGNKGVITEDMGNYIGVTFYGDKSCAVMPCHPTSEVEYLETFNHKPPRMTRSKQRYADFLRADWFDGSFADWLGIEKKIKTT